MTGASPFRCVFEDIDQPVLGRKFSFGFVRRRGGGGGEVYSLCHNFLGPLFLNFLDPPLLGVPSEDPVLNVLISPGPELCFKHKTPNLTLVI